LPNCCCCQVTTEEARVKFIEQLTEAEDWLYGDGETEAADAFKSRLAALKAVGEPIARRAAELELRPQVRVHGLSCVCVHSMFAGISLVTAVGVGQGALR
jgi:hypothetical protein